MMIVFDVDNTLSPTRFPDSPELLGETREAFGFQVFIPTHLLEFIRSRNDTAILSTWGAEAESLVEAFQLPSKVLLMSDFTDERGIWGKFSTIEQLRPSYWADDHITAPMVKLCKDFGTTALVAHGGYVSASQLELMRPES